MEGGNYLFEIVYKRERERRGQVGVGGAHVISCHVVALWDALLAL